ncbi:MAG TPA: tRNA (N6-threonylcarbamoyladenosine(37)-N6)-methyltransferase TrmO [Anaerolineales bacterium]|nr:tRNA (N6-threonylcarbamoyladenosine(37)-N6)-methyltransferase TrmO [Anaerolineae bacterium]HIQ02299.1 tRNA (N6-threonylcarbamoyladenosine(37)-N6)-methyltransferase TrmO [Anaerolineales bacterium]
MELICRPIGVIHSPFQEKRETPIQAAFSKAEGTVEVAPEYAAGLKDLEGFSHIILLYWFHQSEGPRLTVRPFLDREERGLFATRYPARPNPIGISVVELLGREGNRLRVRGVDVLDGTPLLDIKPFVPTFDHREGTEVGWLRGRV